MRRGSFSPGEGGLHACFRTQNKPCLPSGGGPEFAWSVGVRFPSLADVLRSPGPSLRGDFSESRNRIGSCTYARAVLDGFFRGKLRFCGEPRLQILYFRVNFVANNSVRDTVRQVVR